MKLYTDFKVAKSYIGIIGDEKGNRYDVITLFLDQKTVPKDEGVDIFTEIIPLDQQHFIYTLEDAQRKISKSKKQLSKLPKKICNEVLKEADKCFYADPQSETPLTRKALKVILHQIQQKYTKEFENDNT